MRKWWILIGVFVIAGLMVGGWLVWKSQNEEAKNTNLTKQQLTVLPTVAVTNTPTPTTEITRMGNMFVTISSPVNGATVSGTTVLVKGQTVPNADVGVNEKDTVANGKGEFGITMTMDMGENEITIIATNEKGEFAEKTIKVTREQ